METIAVRPKKKHFKKVIEYMRKHEDMKTISADLVDQIISVGIGLRVPDTLGQYVRDLVIHDDVQIKTASYMKFLYFMERCKGYEEDAKKFLMLVPK